MKNPIKQNEKHIQVLKDCGEYIGYKFINVVVFVKSESIPQLKNVIMKDDLYELITEY